MFMNLKIEKLGLVCYLQINEVGKAESRLSFFHNGFRDSLREVYRIKRLSVFELVEKLHNKIFEFIVSHETLCLLIEGYFKRQNN